MYMMAVYSYIYIMHVCHNNPWQTEAPNLKGVERDVCKVLEEGKGIEKMLWLIYNLKTKTNQPNRIH